MSSNPEIYFRCTCGAGLAAPPTAKSRAGECPRCRRVLSVPEDALESDGPPGEAEVEAAIDALDAPVETEKPAPEPAKAKAEPPPPPPPPKPLPGKNDNSFTTVAKKVAPVPPALAKAMEKKAMLAGAAQQQQQQEAPTLSDPSESEEPAAKPAAKEAAPEQKPAEPSKTADVKVTPAASALQKAKEKKAKLAAEAQQIQAAMAKPAEEKAEPAAEDKAQDVFDNLTSASATESAPAEAEPAAAPRQGETSAWMPGATSDNDDSRFISGEPVAAEQPAEQPLPEVNPIEVNEAPATTEPAPAEEAPVAESPAFMPLPKDANEPLPMSSGEAAPPVEQPADDSTAESESSTDGKKKSKRIIVRRLKKKSDEPAAEAPAEAAKEEAPASSEAPAEPAQAEAPAAAEQPADAEPQAEKAKEEESEGARMGRALRRAGMRGDREPLGARKKKGAKGEEKAAEPEAEAAALPPVPCRKCKEEIPEGAELCPGCGTKRPKKGEHMWLWILTPPIVLILTLVVLTAFTTVLDPVMKDLPGVKALKQFVADKGWGPKPTAPDTKK